MKKEYVVPIIMVQNIKTQNILAGSNPSVYNTQATENSCGLSKGHGNVSFDDDDF